MTLSSADAPSPQSRSYGRQVFWSFVAFFGVISTVLALMVTIAIRTQTGLVTDHPYEKGLAYNQVVRAEQEQEALGWKAEIGQEGEKVSVRLQDKSGHPLVPEKVVASFYRPTKDGMDFTASMEAAGPGHYVLSPAFPAKGLWEVRVYVTDHDHHFQHSKRIVVP